MIFERTLITYFSYTPDGIYFGMFGLPDEEARTACLARLPKRFVDPLLPRVLGIISDD